MLFMRVIPKMRSNAFYQNDINSFAELNRMSCLSNKGSSCSSVPALRVKKWNRNYIAGSPVENDNLKAVLSVLYP